jgi:hypothetical protein
VNCPKSTKCSNVYKEVKIFWSEPTISKELDPLLYWKEKMNRFPFLYVKAIKHLSVCMTSTTSEKAFSGGKLLCNHTRGPLSAEKNNYSYLSEVLATIEI